MRSYPIAAERCLLIVDSDQSYADTLLAILLRQGYRAYAAAPGEAISALEKLEGGIVLCDIEAAGDAGKGLQTQILKFRPDLAFIVMVKRLNSPQDARLRNDDAVDTIDKAQGTDAALAVIAKCFEKREAEAAARQAEAALLIAEQNDASAHNARLEFLANVSHELRTPLNAIIGFSEIIMTDVRAKGFREEHKGYIEDIHASGRHLLDVINDILDFARAETGKLVLEERAVDIRAVSEAVNRLIGPKARGTGVKLNIALPEDLPILWCDERKLKQMLINLIGNAVKFTEAGGHIDLEATTSAERFVLSVRDTGIGIAEADLQRVLQPFVQVENALTRQHQGTGLGLPLVKAMVELHGGSLALESAPGKGTCAHLIFPVYRVIHAGKDRNPPDQMEQTRVAKGGM